MNLKRSQQPATPAVAFETPEAAEVVVAVQQRSYLHHMGLAAKHREAKDAKAARLQALSAEMAQLEAGRGDDETQERRETALGRGFESMLTALGAPVPPLSISDVRVHPQTSQGDARAHAEAFGGPQTGLLMQLPPSDGGSFPETRPDGYCIKCGKEAWLSGSSPSGATHSFGPTCNPEDPNSPMATLAIEVQPEQVKAS